MGMALRCVFLVTVPLLLTKAARVALQGLLDTTMMEFGQDTPGFLSGLPDIPCFNCGSQRRKSRMFSGKSTLAPSDDWIVIFKDENAAENLAAFKASQNPGQIKFHSFGKQKVGVPFANFKGGETELAAALNPLKSKIAFIEPNVRFQSIPVVTAKADNENRMMGKPWGLLKIDQAKTALTGKGVHVFVVDTGIRHTHTEFSGRSTGIWSLDAACDGAQCAIDWPNANNGHGTHCAGTAAGRTVGVAPDAKILAVQVFGKTGKGPSSQTLDGMNSILSHTELRPGIVSISISSKNARRSQAGKEALDKLADAGLVVVVAAGNDNDETCQYTYGFIKKSITVGSINAKDERSWFSNYGECNDIYAPGSNVVSASENDDSATKTMSGTSMAAPHVSGAVALLLEAGKAPKDIRALLTKSAVPDIITGLKAGDPNLLLNVGKATDGEKVPPADGAPTTTAAPGAPTTTAAPGAPTTTAEPGAPTTTAAPGASGRTSKNRRVRVMAHLMAHAHQLRRRGVPLSGLKAATVQSQLKIAQADGAI